MQKTNQAEVIGQQKRGSSPSRVQKNTDTSGTNVHCSIYTFVRYTILAGALSYAALWLEQQLGVFTRPIVRRGLQLQNTEFAYRIAVRGVSSTTVDFVCDWDLSSATLVRNDGLVTRQDFGFSIEPGVYFVEFIGLMQPGFLRQGIGFYNSGPHSGKIIVETGDPLEHHPELRSVNWIADEAYGSTSFFASDGPGVLGLWDTGRRQLGWNERIQDAVDIMDDCITSGCNTISRPVVGAVTVACEYASTPDGLNTISSMLLGLTAVFGAAIDDADVAIAISTVTTVIGTLVTVATFTPSDGTWSQAIARGTAIFQGVAPLASTIYFRVQGDLRVKGETSDSAENLGDSGRDLRVGRDYTKNVFRSFRDENGYLGILTVARDQHFSVVYDPVPNRFDIEL